MKLFKGDCLSVMGGGISDESVDMILCDLPYGTTKNKFDVCIDLEALWKEYKRIIKKRGCIALFAQTPFDKILGASNLEMLKYEWIWEKAHATGILNCNFAPMKAHENILIFSKSAASYVKDINNAMVYNPQFFKGSPYVAKLKSPSTNYDMNYQKIGIITDNKGTRYPRSVIKFAHDTNRIHPTQKPVALLEYLIRTYTNENDTVLDNCFGSCSTGVACVHTHRNFIGIEKNDEFFEKGKNWLFEEIKKQGLFSEEDMNDLEIEV